MDECEVFPLDILANIRDPEAQFIVNVLMKDVKGVKLIDKSLVGEKAAVKQATDRLNVLVDAIKRGGSVSTVPALSSLTEVVIIRTSSPLLPHVLLQPKRLYAEARGGQLRVQVINADITQQPVMAIVNPTNSRLLFQKGLSGVIARAAGDDYVKQCQLSVQQHGELFPLSCRTTHGGKLHAQYVIHTVGIRAMSHRSDADALDKMTTVFSHVFAEAERRDVDSIAIPAISAGMNGVSLSIVVHAAIKALLKYITTASRNPLLRDIRFVDITASTVDMFQQVMLQKVCPGVAVATGGGAARQPDDMLSPRNGPPVADAAAVSAFKTNLKHVATNSKSGSNSSNGMRAPKAPPLAASSPSSVASGQGHVDRHHVQAIAHGSSRSSQRTTSNTYDFDVPLKCAGCGTVSTNAKKQQCAHTLCDQCLQVSGRCTQCSAAGAAGVTGIRHTSPIVRDDSDVRSPARGSTNSKSSSSHKPTGKKCDDKASAAAAAASVDDNCAICMCSITDPEKLACGHVFCRPCIKASFARFQTKCPCCGRVFGALKGNQPPGTMTQRILKSALPGYGGCNTIEITYSFNGGIQQQGHPNPGRPYQGTQRTAYLPDNSEGHNVYKLLKQAFDAGLTFTIGQSVTTGQGDVITWNDIHHKTQISGTYGYPDPTYLKRVRDELAAKGIK